MPRHYPHIRLANLAYYGTPLGSFEQSLLRNSVDLVIPNLDYLDDIAAVAPEHPAVRLHERLEHLPRPAHRLAGVRRPQPADREAAFYHVNRADPVQRAERVGRPGRTASGACTAGTDAAGWANVTSDARNAATTVRLRPRPASRWRSATPRSSARSTSTCGRRPRAGGAAKLEYVTAVDAQGRPTAWGTLATDLATAPTGLRRRRAGHVRPAAGLGAGVGQRRRPAVLRPVPDDRRRAPPRSPSPCSAGTTRTHGAAGGTIPAFDSAADRDGDGYLNDAEYAAGRPGFDARFVYESRLIYPNYGPMRFATNVADPGVPGVGGGLPRPDRWPGLPLADGFFVDNSIGRLAVDPTGIKESLSGYAADYGSLLGAINRRLGAREVGDREHGRRRRRRPSRSSGTGCRTWRSSPAADQRQPRPVRRPGGRRWRTAGSSPAGRPTRSWTACRPARRRDRPADPAGHPGHVLPARRPGPVVPDDERRERAGQRVGPALDRRRPRTTSAGRPAAHKVFATGTDPTNARLDYKVYAAGVPERPGAATSRSRTPAG